MSESEAGERSSLPLASQEDRVGLMMQLCDVVRRTGSHILEMSREEIYDTVEDGQHQFSTVDAEGSNMMRAALDDSASKWSGTILEESDSSQQLTKSDELTYPVFVCDAVEGSVNAKRGLAAMLDRPINAGTSVMVLETEQLWSTAASAFFDFASRKVFSCVRGERGSFLAFIDGAIVSKEHVETVRGDTQRYVVVPGYSNSNIDARAEVERRLTATGLSTTGGSRSSAQDLIDIVGNQVDGYVDLRALYTTDIPGRDEVLHSWDVGGVLPVLAGLGFCIMDEKGNDWQECVFRDPLALVVARPDVADQIMGALSKLSFIETEDDGQSDSIRLPPTRIG